jgi:16S rRNA (guanine966-N2)-methyltransferase
VITSVDVTVASVRVVAGTAKGRPLVAPPGTDTRPTSDRVREAIFNALGSLDAVAGARVLDLFAGSGALGIEALSRGAASATFVDTSPKAVEAVRANLAATGLTGTVIRADAHRYDDGPFDLALLDPPYATTDDEWAWLLDHLQAGLVVLESDRAIDLGPSWEVLRSKQYGNTMVQIARRKGAQ